MQYYPTADPEDQTAHPSDPTSDPTAVIVTSAKMRMLAEALIAVAERAEELAETARAFAACVGRNRRRRLGGEGARQ